MLDEIDGLIGAFEFPAVAKASNSGRREVVAREHPGKEVAMLPNADVKAPPFHAGKAFVGPLSGLSTSR
jgi:hypothetical protein